MNNNKELQITCFNCGETNPPDATYCIKCNMAISQNATLDPIQSAISEGNVLGNAISKPPSIFILIGMWLLCMPCVIFFGILLFTAIKEHSFLPMIYLGPILLLFIIMPIMTTRNYIIKIMKVDINNINNKED